MQTKYIVIVIIVLLIIGGGYFLLRGSYSPQAPAPIQTPIGTPEGTPSQTQVLTSEVKEITVVGTEFSFNPASISVKAGEKVKINFKNNGRAPHNLFIEELGIGTKTIGGGQTAILEFSAPSSGTYTFFCSVPSHRASGMEGELKVE